MITLTLDTSHKYLVIGLFDEDRELGSISKYCPKRQSEEIITSIDSICKNANVKPMDIDQVVITKGPGSYTGVRIAMTVAKVFTALRNIPLYTLSTLDLYSTQNCSVLMDARGKRAYFAKYRDGKRIYGPVVDSIESFGDLIEGEIVGDGSLIGKEDYYPNLALQFINHKDLWERVDNVHTLVPEYLKDSSEYLVKK